MSNTGYHLTYFCYFFRLIWSLQNFTAAVAIINNNDTIRNNFALQIHEINLETVVLPQVFVANLGDIDQLQVANSSFTEDDFPTFGSMSDIEGQPTVYASLPESLFVPGNDTVLRVNYAVFFNDVLFQLRSMSELAETFEQSETGSIIISARVGSGPPPENLTDPGAVFFFQKSEVCYLSLCARLCQSSECYNVVVSFITFPTSCTSHYVQNVQNGSNTTCVFWDFNEDGLLLMVHLGTGVI